MSDLLEQLANSVDDVFPDKDELLEENRLYAAILVEKGVILGDNHGMLNPGGYLTRAEVAVILDRLYSSLS